MASCFDSPEVQSWMRNDPCWEVNRRIITSCSRNSQRTHESMRVHHSVEMKADKQLESNYETDFYLCASQTFRLWVLLFTTQPHTYLQPDSTEGPNNLSSPSDPEEMRLDNGRCAAECCDVTVKLTHDICDTVNIFPTCFKISQSDLWTKTRVQVQVRFADIPPMCSCHMMFTGTGNLNASCREPDKIYQLAHFLVCVIFTSYIHFQPSREFLHCHF